jgi:hypothetical protein
MPKPLMINGNKKRDHLGLGYPAWLSKPFAFHRQTALDLAHQPANNVINWTSFLADHSRQGAYRAVGLKTQATDIFSFRLLPDPDPSLSVLISILPSTSINSKTNLEIYCFVTSLWLSIMYMYLQKVPNKQKNIYKIWNLEGPWRREQDPQHWWKLWIRFKYAFRRNIRYSKQEIR